MSKIIFYEKEPEINELYKQYLSEFSTSTMIINAILKDCYNFIDVNGDIIDNEALSESNKLISEYQVMQSESYSNINKLNEKYETSILFKEVLNIVLNLVDKTHNEIDKFNGLYSPKVVIENIYLE